MALAINEEFNPWSGNISPDGIWRKAGVWFGTGGNELDPARAVLTSTYPGETSTGFLHLTITPSTNPLEGAEIQSLSGYGYGTYEVRMMPSSVSGGVASFFLIGAPDYREPEFDIEFLLNAHNQVTFTNHPGSGTTYYNLGFDPTADFHNYGIIWTPNPDGTATVADTVDGVIVHSETSANFVASPAGEFIMMNAWSGNANFGGGPPTQNSTTVYDWVHYTPYGATPPPSAGSIAISNASITEGNSGTKLETFTVTRTGGTAAFDVTYGTSNGTATVTDNDYVASASVLHFTANQNTATVSVTINGDTKVEANETFNVNLSNATNGTTISDGLGVGTITNDDGSVSEIVGTPGDDVIPGTAGADTMQGLTGDDTYTVNNAGDKAIEAANAGTDKVEAWVSYTLPDNVETLQLMGTGALNGTGNALNNTINGNNATNMLSGGDGNDVLDGRGGIDTLFGGAGGDTFVFGDKIQADGDKVMDFVHGVDKLDFHLIDARESRRGDQAFGFDGYSGGNHRNGDLWLTEDQAANVTHVYADTGPTVFHVDLAGTHLGLTASDFIL